MSQMPPPYPQHQAYLAPHRGGTILTLGIISLVINVFSGILGLVLPLCCMGTIIPLATGIPAWVMANRDIRLMTAGQMDPAGISSTSAGKVCAIISVVISVIGGVLSVALVVLGVAFFAAAAAGA